jgi:hypothetical protein
MIGALTTGGVLERSDEALCALARCSADALDFALAYGEKLYAVSAMMRTHLQIVEGLAGRARSDGEGDGASELIAYLNSPEVLGFDPPYPGWAPGHTAPPSPRMVNGVEMPD